MRVTPEQLDYMRVAIQTLVDRRSVPAMKATLKSWNEAKSANSRATVYRWWLFYIAKLDKYARKVLYPAGLNDNHIDTALRHIVPDEGVASV